MSRGAKIEEEELKTIRFMLESGKSGHQIARMMDRSPEAIRHITKKMDYTVPPIEKKVNRELREWLQENWRWEIPERKPKRAVRKPVKPKTLITPYNYPAMRRHEGDT